MALVPDEEPWNATASSEEVSKPKRSVASSRFLHCTGPIEKCSRAAF